MSFYRLSRIGAGVFAAGAVLLLVVGEQGDVCGQPQSKKPPVPDQKALAEAEGLIRELFRDDLDKAARDKAVKLKLAQTFLAEGRDTNDNPGGKYVLFREAWLLAGQAGDAAVALQALEEMAANFAVQEVEILKAKIQALQSAVQSAATPDNHQFIVDAASVLQDEAVAADEFETAAALGAVAENAAKKLKRVQLVVAVQNRNAEVTALQTDYAKVKPFVEALKKNPQDAAANLEVGKYHAFIKGNWDKGLPLLARGGDAALKELAAKDMQHPKSGASEAALGAAWAAQAAKLQDAAARHAYLRAYQWYQQALATAGAKERAAVEKQLVAINAQLPPEYRAGEIAVELRRFDGHVGPVYGAALSGDGARVVSGGADRSVRLWDARNGSILRRFDGHEAPVWTVAISGDGRRLVSGSFDRSIRMWDPLTGRESKRLAGHDDYVRSLAFSRDGHVMLSGGDDRLVKLWLMSTGAESSVGKGHEHFVFGVAVSPDGQRGLSASLDKTVRYWNLANGSTLKSLSGHSDTVLSVAFSPDGHKALSGSTDGTMRLWDLESGVTLREFTGHKGYIHSVAYSPDGRRALSAGQDGKLRVWDVDTGKLLRTLNGHIGAIWSVGYSADGRFAVTAGQDGTVRLWGSER